MPLKPEKLLIYFPQFKLQHEERCKVKHNNVIPILLTLKYFFEAQKVNFEFGDDFANPYKNPRKGFPRVNFFSTSVPK